MTDLLSPHDESTADRWHALRRRLDARGVGMPATWKQTDAVRALLISKTEVERQETMSATVNDLGPMFAGHPGAESIAEACQLAGVDAAAFERRMAAIPAPDDAGLLWLIDEYTRAERDGTLLPQLAAP